MKLASSTLLGMALVAPGILVAQSTPASIPLDSVSIGASIRARTDSGARISGTFAGSGAESLFVSASNCYECIHRYALSSIRELELGRHGTAGEQTAHVFADAGWGVLIVLGAGAIAGAAAAEHAVKQPNCGEFCGLAWLAVPYLAAIGGGAGLVVGAVVGIGTRERYWLRVELPISPH